MAPERPEDEAARRRRRLEEIFGDVLPDVTSDERVVGEGSSTSGASTGGSRGTRAAERPRMTWTEAGAGTTRDCWASGCGSSG